MPSLHRIAVLGATGATGRLIVARALRDGHAVTAFVRAPERLATAHPSLRVVSGDVLAEGNGLDGALEGNDVVVSALGRGTSLRSQGLMARATPRILSAMERTGASRLLFLSAYGVGGTAAEAPFLIRMMFRLMLSDIYADKAAAESFVLGSGLNWTILAPVMLTNAPATGRFRVGENVRVPGFSRISRADVADCLVGAIDDRDTFRKRLVVAS